MNTIQDFITSDPATVAAAKADEQLNSELGLMIPDNVLTENLAYWQTFFRTLRNMYRADMLDKNDVQTKYIPGFISIPDNQKQAFLNDLIAQIDNKLIEIQEAETILDMDEIQEKIDKIMSILSPELQIEFVKQLNGGQIPEDLEREIQQYSQDDAITDEEAEAYASYRLTHALDRRYNLDARKFNTPLAPHEVQNIVDEHDQIITPTVAQVITRPIAPAKPITATYQVQNTQPVQQNIPQIPIPQNNIVNFDRPQPVQQNYDSSDFEEITNSNIFTVPTQIIPTIASSLPHKKIATLDDLLHEK